MMVYFLVPSAPLDFKAELQTSSEVLLKWQEPDFQNGNISGYIVKYYKRGEAENTATTKDKSYFLNNLNGCTFYNTKVAANTSAGYGETTSTNFTTTVESKSLICLYCL